MNLNAIGSANLRPQSFNPKSALHRVQIEESNLKDVLPLTAGAVLFVVGLILLELGNVSCVGGPGIPCQTDTIYHAYSDAGTLLTILGLITLVIGIFIRNYRPRGRANSTS